LDLSLIKGLPAERSQEADLLSAAATDPDATLLKLPIKIIIGAEHTACSSGLGQLKALAAGEQLYKIAALRLRTQLKAPQALIEALHLGQQDLLLIIKQAPLGVSGAAIWMAEAKVDAAGQTEDQLARLWKEVQGESSLSPGDPTADGLKTTRLLYLDREQKLPPFELKADQRATLSITAAWKLAGHPPLFIEEQSLEALLSQRPLRARHLQGGHHLLSQSIGFTVKAQGFLESRRRAVLHHQPSLYMLGAIEEPQMIEATRGFFGDRKIHMRASSLEQRSLMDQEFILRATQLITQPLLVQGA